MIYIFIKVCGDKYAGCEPWAAEGDCDTNPQMMLRYCRRACKTCAPTPEGTELTPGKTYSINSELRQKNHLVQYIKKQ